MDQGCCLGWKTPVELHLTSAQSAAGHGQPWGSPQRHCECMHVRASVGALVWVHTCVCKYVSGLVCLFAHLGAGENMYVCVCVRVCAVRSTIQDPSQSRLLWGVSVPSPWLVGDNRNFLELTAPEVTVFPGLALLVRKKRREPSVQVAEMRLPWLS